MVVATFTGAFQESPSTRLSAYDLVTASVLLVGVGTVTVPVNVGEAMLAFRLSAFCKSVCDESAPIINHQTHPLPAGH